MTVESAIVLLFAFDIALIYLIYSYNPKSILNRFLSLLLIPSTLTNLVMLLLRAAVETVSVEIGYKLAFFSAVFTFPLFYHFSFYFPRRRSSSRLRAFLPVLYGFPVLLGTTFVLTFQPGTALPSVGDLIRPQFFLMRNPVYYSVHSAGLIYILIFLSLTVQRLLRTLKLSLLKRERRTVIMVLAGFIPLSFILLLDYLIFVPLKGGIYFYLATALAYTTYFVVLILQFGFLDRKSLARVFITYPVLITILILAYTWFLTPFNMRMAGLFNVQPSFLISLEILFVLVVLLPLIRTTQSALLARFSTDSRDILKTYKNASAGLVQIIDLGRLDRFLEEYFVGRLGLARFFFLLFDPESGQFLPVSRLKDAPELPADGELSRKLARERKILDMQQIAMSWEGGRELEVLDALKITLVVPLMEGENLSALCLLGEPAVARPWHRGEIEALEFFASELPVVIARCRTYRQAIELEKRQARIERLAALSEITSSVAHEIRNPLSIISASAETLAEKKLSPRERKRLADYIQEEAQRMSTLLTRILSFAPDNELVHRSSDVGEVVRQTLELAAPRARDGRIDLRLTCPREPCFARIDREAFIQVCVNLVLNAIEALPPGGKLSVQVTAREEEVEILFTDNGGKIPEEIAGKIFDAFFTTKEGGTGLGLSVSQRLVRDAGGELNLVPGGKGNVFQVILPASCGKERP